MEINLNIAEDFGKRTGLRHHSLSDHSGEEFYIKFLNPYFYEFLNFDKKDKFIVSLDGLRGISPSFIDEAFGNLVYDFTLDIVEKYVYILATDKSISSKKLIENETFKEWELRRKKSILPKRTMKNVTWKRYDNNSFIECTA